MYLVIGEVVIPPVPHDLIVSAFDGAEGHEGPAVTGWWPTAAETQPFWWYSGVRLVRRNSSTAFGMVGNVAEGDNPSESHIVVTGETAALLDAEFAAGTPPVMTLSDGETTINFGAAQLHTRTLVKPADDPAQSVWIYELCFYTTDTYRTSIQRRHAGSWLDVMLADTYPAEGSPPIAGPTLHDRGEETTYVYANNQSAVNGPIYVETFDVQFDSGCRYAQTLAPVGRRADGQWERSPPRFWTLAHARRVADEEWAKYSDRIIFGGRIPAERLAGNLPRTISVDWEITDPPSSGTQTAPTGIVNAVGTESFDVGIVADVTDLVTQLDYLVAWETETRRHFVTVFHGLVPWRMTPLDTSIEWRLPIDGVQRPVTILYGVEARTDVTPAPTVANPAPAGGTITVRFTRPASPTTGHDTPPAGQLTRTDTGSTSPPFVPPAMTGTTVDYVYDSLADGEYTVAPGSPWSPTSASVTVANGSTHLIEFNYVEP